MSCCFEPMGAELRVEAAIAGPIAAMMMTLVSGPVALAAER